VRSGAHLRAPCVAAQPNEKPPSGPKAAPRCGDIGCGCRVGKLTKPPSFPSGSSARAALWTTRDFGLVADLTVVIKKAARPFSPFDRRAALKVSTQQVTVLLWGRDALTQITKIGCGKAAERTWRLRWRERGVQLSVTSGGGQHARRLHAQRLRREQQRHLLRLRRRDKLRHQ